MSNRSLARGFQAAAAVALGLVFVAPRAGAVPKPGVRRPALQLFAGFLSEMTINRFTCGLDAQGHVCSDPKGSTTVGGGFWPQKPDQYVFGAGTQVTGVVDPSLTGFGWAGDTTAAFFEDPSGQHENGDKLSLIWSATNPDDINNWPRDAYVPNTQLYAPVLRGRKTLSQQDVWTRYWDGNPTKNAGRPHPLGVMVDERGLAWNFPSGNEDIQYWIFTITNITASKASVYGTRTDADSLTSYGRQFKAANDAAFAVSIPDTGYTITNAYFAFAIDADVDAGGAKQNLTTVNLPFNMGVAFKSNWYTDPNTSGFVYPPLIFPPPFATTVGEVGVKYLKSPLIDPANPFGGEIGLVLYSATVNAGAFGDAANAAQVYRYLSGTLDVAKGDAPCNYNLSTGQTRSQAHVCYIPTTPDDIRFFESSGPFTLKPGQSQTIAVALIAAAPVNNPAIAARGPALVFPTGGAFPAQPESLATGSATLTALDSVFGALTIVGDTGGAPAGGPSGKIEQNEITTVPRSLFGKALVAQAVFDALFLLPFPPDAPNFFLIPGDNQVTVVWSPSNTETVPDPYFAVASDPIGQLYDPNYRDLDVQGYRIYRGRSAGDLELIAQFDYAGKEFIDFTAQIPYGNCAPELGVTTDCPPDLGTGHHVAIAQPFIQIPPGGRVELANGAVALGTIQINQADTAGTGGGVNGTCKPSPCLPLRNNGVPFAYVDNGVRNGFTYFYTVAAFDINSVKSTGASYTALEGRPAARTVVPRKNSTQVNEGTLAVSIVGGDGSTLSGAAPTLASNGTFSGPAAPTDGISLGFPAFLPAVVKGDSVRVIIDSIAAGFGDPDGYGTGGPATYYVRALGPFPTTPYAVPLFVDPIDVTDTAKQLLPKIPFDQTLSGTYGGDSTYALLPQLTLAAPGAWRLASWGRSSINADPANADFNGPRWWAGAANENTADPNGLMCSPAAGGCVQADLSRNAGAISGVGIFHPQSYSTVNSFPLRDLESIGATVYRAADFKVYWATTPGAVDSVVDVTHHVKVKFSARVGPTWGFLNGASFAAIPSGNTPDNNSAMLTWTDIFCTEPSATLMAECGASAAMQNTAQLSPVLFQAGTFANAAVLGAAPSTGNGFIFYLNGHFFLMQMAALPSSTVWYARFYAGNITGAVGGYKFQAADVRPPAVPGLTVRAKYTSTKFDASVTADSSLAKIHTVPDPYYVTNQFEQSTTSKVLRFVNLPSQCIIRIYSLSGVLVQVLTVNDATGGAEAQWNLRNRNQQVVASGVYFYHVETPDGKAKIGRFTLVNYAQ
ncbi:MAG TPA: T9SS type A sorting domain-containing protein [Gemmatimonadales bacterium]|nr:T9SS type A sorting domain-containing protein [Gemmatimonadales bacterium]